MELAEQNMKDGAEIVEHRHPDAPRERLHLRLLVPGGGRQAEPAPVDRPAVRAASTRRSSRDDLSERDPANADYYAANYASVRRADQPLRRGDAHLVRHDPARQAQAADLPRRLRLLRRGLRLGRSSARSRSTTSRTRPPRRSRGLIDQVRDAEGAGDLRLRGLPRPVLEQIGKETGVRYVDILRDDDLPGAAGRRGALVARPDAVRLHDHDRGHRRRRERPEGPATRPTSRPTARELPAMTGAALVAPRRRHVPLRRATRSLLDVDLDVAAGQFIGVVGPSGSGKTTLLRASLGPLRPDAGRGRAARRACGSATCRRSRRSTGTSPSPSASAC